MGSESIQGHTGSVNSAVIYIGTREINYKRLAGMSYPACPLLNCSRVGASATEAGGAFHSGMVQGK